MVNAFQNLSEEEIELMLQVPLLVTILIAGADGNIDKSEVSEAISIAKGKRTRARKELQQFYSEVAQDFEDKLKAMIHNMPSDQNKRAEDITAQLSKVNDILPRLEKSYATKFYESTKDLAKKIAEASGGILGYMSIGYEESKLINLDMLKKP